MVREATSIRLIGVPMDLGQNLRGVDMGPSALRYAGLADRLARLGHQVQDAGNVEVAVRGTLDAERQGIAYLEEISRSCERVYEAGRRAIADGCFPLFIGGDHSIAVGTIGGVTHEGSVGVLWIDAHGDYNTPETSPSGNVHGMPLAALMGLGAPELVDLGRPGPKLRPEDVMLLAVRDLDASERKLLRESRIGIYTMSEIDERGIAEVTREALRRLGHCERLHVSLDMDSLDPMYAPGVGTPVPGGLTFREAHLLMEILAEDGRVGSADVVEINPMLDEHNRTAEMAAALLMSLLGKSIL
ncbi:arginase [Rhodocaloribacter litoris]|uniref:arginase n=1 Tax=Rhodocaloribacter litoris TaxID=2558931 RepID=UPI0014249503|nr:arginase [Rhodocaloribacter litoris]QXD13960.1 arginase [Rhodocaloribacter litoris]